MNQLTVNTTTVKKLCARGRCWLRNTCTRTERKVVSARSHTQRHTHTVCSSLPVRVFVSLFFDPPSPSDRAPLPTRSSCPDARLYECAVLWLVGSDAHTCGSVCGMRLWSGSVLLLRIKAARSLLYPPPDPHWLLFTVHSFHWAQTRRGSRGCPPPPLSLCPHPATVPLSQACQDSAGVSLAHHLSCVYVRPPNARSLFGLLVFHSVICH